MSNWISQLGLSELGLSNPAYCWLLPLALLPLIVRSQAAFDYPSIIRLPVDPISTWLDRLWRVFGALAIGSIILGLSGVFWKNHTVEHVGRGAHVMIVLDRSASMNDNFAGQQASDESNKMAVARKVLQNFVAKSREDLLGVVTFSTSPIMAAPMGGDRESVLSALKATEAGGMGFTAVARGLGMALDYFEGKPMTGSRVVLLVSDGGAHLESKTQDMLRNQFKRQGSSLYWIFLRSANSPGLTKPEEEGNDDAYPEYHLHRFFGTLGVAYQAYEAENPLAVEQAMADIAKLKNQPVRYQEAAPRLDLSNIFYLIAFLCTCGLLAFYFTEVKQWRNA
ncbi:MAG: vWA domain-containing protein [Methylotenera sp.]|jgi:mxaC protein|nr:vWA domain-containing protein [Methylotenera sp.]HPH07894.1 vWA domain-containing protein [Methylotenera sp.]HPM50021.1 vWA domain-containing protein [Methylotenera sp.]HQM86969.1 vWA domain-containing protein [Methylotenera sp.]